jgi:hypothetical protein
MNGKKAFRCRWIASIGVMACAFLLSSCGGGGAAALLSGVGSGGTGFVEGLVVGFGSVFVDGTEFSVNNATIVEQEVGGVSQKEMFKLGERVRVTLDSTGTSIVSATIIDQLTGPVTSSAVQDPTGDWWMQVAGQWVRVVSTASNTPVGLVTVLSAHDYPSPASPGNLVAGNEVEVYGMWAWDASHNAYVLVASRVEETSLTPTTSNVLMGGVVVALPGSGQIQLNASSTGTIVQGALPTDVAVGKMVTAIVSRSLWNAWAGGTTPLPATSITVSDLATQSSASTGASAVLSGFVTNFNATNNTAVVQGSTVVLPAGTTVGDGDYLRVSGVVSNGTISGSKVENDSKSGTAASPQTIQVIATTNGINWSAGGTVNFLLQGTAISAAAGTYPTCATLTAANMATVTVTGYAPIPGQPVTANSVTCSTTASSAVTDYKGTIVSVNPAAFSLTFSNEGSTLNVVWNSNTYLDSALGTVGSGWNGQSVEVIGTLSGTTLTATVIRSDATATND